MKRTLIIVLGILLVLILVGIWMYILFFSVSKPDVYTDLNFENTTDVIDVGVVSEQKNESIVDVADQSRLRQLTTSQVAGYQEVIKDASSSPEVYYVKSGTGYVYSIDLETGEEKRISGTTIPETEKAAITPDGKFILVQSGFGSKKQFAIWSIGEGESGLSEKVILQDVVDFQATLDNTFFYSLKVDNNIVAMRYATSSKTAEILFRVPFAEVVIDWGISKDGPHYVYPKPNSRLEGYLYEASGKTIKRLPVEGLGLSAHGNKDSVLYSAQVIKNNYKTSIYKKESGVVSNYPIGLLPEKCVSFIDQPSFICVITHETQFSPQTPDDWYQGTISYQDDLWEINPLTGASVYLVDTRAESGRTIDIIDLVINQSNSNIYFKNKNDNTLWLYLLVETKD
ncbi:hypothetical protein KC730_00890 [Candidatus Kaiserbacteria bacterium]|nr:hypothetical protein [Candidatus Kaiserbacteria bacterium]